MAKFKLRTKKDSGTAKLYFKVKRPALKIQWELCSGIDVDVAAWRKAEASADAFQRYIKTDKGKEVNEQMGRVEELVKHLFDDGKLTCNDDKHILDEALSAFICEDAIQELEAIEQRKLEEEEKQREEEERKKRTIVNFYDRFVGGMADGTTRQKKSTVYREGTIRAWKDFGKYLKSYTPEDMTFADITKKFKDGFRAYLEKQGLMPKTINKQILCYRRLCNAAKEDGINANGVSYSWSEKTVKDNEKRAEIALSDEEINALYDMPLTGIREQVRDIFILGVLSAQRVSDYTMFKKENFKTTENGTNVIVFQQVKTGTDMVIPIIDNRVLEICRKYEYDFPQLDKRDINRYIKTILHTLSADVKSLRNMEVTQLSMAERRKEEVYQSMCKRVEAGEVLHGEELKRYKQMTAYAQEHKSDEGMLYKRDYADRVVCYRWELVSTHTARRSGITQLYNSNLLDTRDMMSISGHQTLKHFEGYIKRGSIEQAERIAKKMQQAKKVKMRKEA